MIQLKYVIYDKDSLIVKASEKLKDAEALMKAIHYTIKAMDMEIERLDKIINVEDDETL